MALRTTKVVSAASLKQQAVRNLTPHIQDRVNRRLRNLTPIVVDNAVVLENTNLEGLRRHRDEVVLALTRQTANAVTRIRQFRHVRTHRYDVITSSLSNSGGSVHAASHSSYASGVVNSGHMHNFAVSRRDQEGVNNCDIGINKGNRGISGGSSNTQRGSNFRSRFLGPVDHRVSKRICHLRQTL